MKISDLADKKIIICGFGREGQATLEVLERKLPGATIFVTDENTAEGEMMRPSLFVSVDQTLQLCDQNTVVIKSPGIPPHRPAVARFLDRGAVITSATNLFFAERKGRGTIIGITGTKGKSTTAALLAHTLKSGGLPVLLVGNIGVPMLSTVEAPDETIFVVELSSYMLADLEVGPDIAVILNLYEEHMDWHETVAAYHEAKWNIAAKQQPGDLLIYNGASSILTALASRAPARQVPFQKITDPRLHLLKLKGEHNRENACAVLLVAELFGVGDEKISEAFSTFEPLPHRLEEVATVNGVLYVNDSISTTPQSALSAISVYAERLGAIILGGKDRGYDFSELAATLKDLPGVTTLILPGGERIAQALQENAALFQRVESLDQAVGYCHQNLKPDQVCLLSPASPSYGYFKNFEERGEKFRSLVLERK
jgi:UDP-N-acetylmuramoylalanine--D-glutamate ligase